jgi:hypothetical protein
MNAQPKLFLDEEIAAGHDHGLQGVARLDGQFVGVIGQALVALLAVQQIDKVEDLVADLGGQR